MWLNPGSGLGAESLGKEARFPPLEECLMFNVSCFMFNMYDDCLSRYGAE